MGWGETGCTDDLVLVYNRCLIRMSVKTTQIKELYNRTVISPSLEMKLFDPKHYSKM